MKLSTWAKRQGITYKAAWNMYSKGLLPQAYQLPTGTIIVPEESDPKKEYVVTYSRVSSSENKDNLQAQSERLISYCNAKGWGTNENIKEIGSGLNDKRPKLIKIFQEAKATKLVVEHNDRLTRFGMEYLKLLCEKINCELVVLNPPQNEQEDLMSDFVSVITSFCARLYGQRRNKRNTEKLIESLKNDPC